MRTIFNAKALAAMFTVIGLFAIVQPASASCYSDTCAGSGNPAPTQHWSGSTFGFSGAADIQRFGNSFAAGEGTGPNLMTETGALTEGGTRADVTGNLRFSGNGCTVDCGSIAGSMRTRIEGMQRDVGFAESRNGGTGPSSAGAGTVARSHVAGGGSLFFGRMQ